MKKKILLSFLAITLIASASIAQTFIASFGVEQSWGVPHRVSHLIDNHYYDYNWVHTRKIIHHGNIEFEVMLQRGNVFIEIRIDPFGHAYRTVRRNYYPLYDHVCGNNCGYHSNYYQAFYTNCHGHNHVNYHHNSHHFANGYNNGHKNGHQHNDYYNQKNRSYANNRKSHKSDYPTRRGEYNKLNESGSSNHDRTSNKKYNNSGRSNSNSGAVNRKRVATTVSRKTR